MRTLLVLLALLILAPSEASAQDQLTKQALTRIEKYEKLEPDLQAGDVATANKYLTALNYAGKRLNAVYDKTETHYKAAVKRYQDLRTRIETKAKGNGPKPKPAQGYDYEKLLQLNKEIGNAFENLKLLNVSHLADPFRSKSVQKEIDTFTERLAAFPADDVNVKVVADNLASFKKLFDIGMSQLKKDQGGAAETEAKMDALSKKYVRANLPDHPELPLTEAELRLWASEIQRWRNQEMPADLEYVRSLKANSAVNQQRVSSLMHAVGVTWPRYLEEAERGMRDKANSAVFDLERFTDWILEVDPKDRNQVQNRILGKGAFDGNMKTLREQEAGVRVAALWDQLMQVKDGPDRAAQGAKVQRAIQYLQELAVQCLDQVRMPAAASTDADLLKAAAEVLKKPDSGVGAYQRLVINSPMVRKQKREAYISGGAVSARIEYYLYEWDQFQVTTAEQEGDEVWLYANTMKKYLQGDSTTSTGRWMLTGRIQLTRILPENVTK